MTQKLFLEIQPLSIPLNTERNNGLVLKHSSYLLAASTKRVGDFGHFDAKENILLNLHLRCFPITDTKRDSSTSNGQRHWFVQQSQSHFHPAWSSFDHKSNRKFDSPIFLLNSAIIKDGQISRFCDDFHFLFISTTKALQSKSFSNKCVHLVPVQLVLDPVCQSQISRSVSFSSRRQQIWMSHLQVKLCHSALVCPTTSFQYHFHQAWPYDKESANGYNSF